jgi:hypothetical protein
VALYRCYDKNDTIFLNNAALFSTFPGRAATASMMGWLVWEEGPANRRARFELRNPPMCAADNPDDAMNRLWDSHNAVRASQRSRHFLLTSAPRFNKGIKVGLIMGSDTRTHEITTSSRHQKHTQGRLSLRCTIEKVFVKISPNFQQHLHHEQVALAGSTQNSRMSKLQNQGNARAVSCKTAQVSTAR